MFNKDQSITVQSQEDKQKIKQTCDRRLFNTNRLDRKKRVKQTDHQEKPTITNTKICQKLSKYSNNQCQAKFT